MQIVCPNCSARYVVDPGAIGQQGRTVQCMRCGHRWLAHAQTDSEAVLTDTRPVPDFIIRPQNHDEPVSLPTIPPERGMPTWLKVTLGLLILLGVIGGAGYALRDVLPGWVPGATPASGPLTPPSPAKPPTSPSAAPGVGTPPAPTKPGTPPMLPTTLLLENVRLEAAPGGGRAVMASGDIVNTGTTEIAPRRIRFIFKDQDRKPMGERAFDLKPDRIAPQGRQPFRQRIDEPPAGAVDVEVAVEPLS